MYKIYPLYSKCCIQFPSHILLFSIARSMYSLPFPVSYCLHSPPHPCHVRELFTILYCSYCRLVLFLFPCAPHKAIYRCASEMASAEKNKYLYADLENKSHVIWRCARWRASWCTIPRPACLAHFSLLHLLGRHLSLLKFWVGNVFIPDMAQRQRLYTYMCICVYVCGSMPGTQLVRSITHKKWVRNCA